MNTARNARLEAMKKTLSSHPDLSAHFGADSLELSGCEGGAVTWAIGVLGLDVEYTDGGRGDESGKIVNARGDVVGRFESRNDGESQSAVISLRKGR